jgi:hypothetical protein
MLLFCVGCPLSVVTILRNVKFRASFLLLDNIKLEDDVSFATYFSAQVRYPSISRVNLQALVGGCIFFPVVVFIPGTVDNFSLSFTIYILNSFKQEGPQMPPSSSEGL